MCSNVLRDCLTAAPSAALTQIGTHGNTSCKPLIFRRITTSNHRCSRTLEENLGFVSVKLTPDDLRLINTEASKIPVQGRSHHGLERANVPCTNVTTYAISPSASLERRDSED